MTDTEKCRKVAELLGWEVDEDAIGAFTMDGDRELYLAPDWPFAGAVLEELARRAKDINILFDGANPWDVAIGHEVALADTAPAAIIDAALAALGGGDG